VCLDADGGPGDECRYPEYDPDCQPCPRAVVSLTGVENEKQMKYQTTKKTGPFAVTLDSWWRHPNGILKTAKAKAVEVDVVECFQKKEWVLVGSGTWTHQIHP
jgi:hypothetical protein